MFMKILKNVFLTFESIVNKGDKYYGTIIKFSHVINFLYIGIFTFMGIHVLKHQMLHDFNTGIQIMVCGLLLFKFHPFKEHVLKQSDSALIFSSAVFLFFNLSIIEIINKYTSKAGININKHTELIRSTGEVIMDAEE
jgi:hypothetical protein